jgi:hypothetical protein
MGAMGGGNATRHIKHSPGTDGRAKDNTVSIMPGELLLVQEIALVEEKC